MALDFPSSPAVNDTYTDDNAAVWQWDGEKWDVITRSTKRAFKGAKVVLSSDYSLGSTSTAIQWSSANFDTATLWAPSQPTRFTITENGFYRLNIQILTTTAGTGASYGISVRRNGLVISSDTIASNQFIVFDDIVQLAVGDYVEVFASESTSAGSIDANDSFFEIVQVGQNLGTGISSWSAFSGARTYINSSFNLTSTPTAISYDGIVYDQNADVLGATYWSAVNDTRLTVKVDGYYRVKTLLTTSDAGSANSYDITLKKNANTNLESTSIGPSATLLLDEIYNLTTDDYLEIYVDNNDSTGSLANTAYIEITRLGV
jgi:hypothetical protein